MGEVAESLVNRSPSGVEQIRRADFLAQMRGNARPGPRQRAPTDAASNGRLIPVRNQVGGGIADQAGRGAGGASGARMVGRQFGDGEVQLPGHLDSAHRVTAKEFRVAMNESRAECEGQQQNERDCGQSPVGDRGALTLLRAGLMAASIVDSLPVGRRALMLLGAGLVYGAGRHARKYLSIYHALSRSRDAPGFGVI